MAEKLCELKKKGGGGGKYTETSLWTNSAPTSNFGSQDVTLSESIDNFKYIGIRYRTSTSVESENTDIYSIEDVKKSLGQNSTNHPEIFIGACFSDNSMMTRSVVYRSSTTLSFGTCYKSAANVSNNAYVIPLEILGLNELSTEPVIMKKIGEISLPAGTATVTGNLSENISDYKNLLVSMVEYNGSSIPLTGIGSTILGLFTTNYFASNNPVGYYGIGNQGSMSYYSITMQKMSDTSIKFTRSNTTGARTAYVYGIK